MGSDTDGSDGDGVEQLLSPSPKADDEDDFTEKLKVIIVDLLGALLCAHGDWKYAAHMYSRRLEASPKFLFARLIGP